MEELKKRGVWVGENARQWVVVCPRCSKEKGREYKKFYVSKDEGLFHCFRCETKGRGFLIYPRLLMEHVVPNTDNEQIQKLYEELKNEVRLFRELNKVLDGETPAVDFRPWAGVLQSILEADPSLKDVFQPVLDTMTAGVSLQQSLKEITHNPNNNTDALKILLKNYLQLDTPRWGLFPKIFIGINQIQTLTDTTDAVYRELAPHLLEQCIYAEFKNMADVIFAMEEIFELKLELVKQIAKTLKPTAGVLSNTPADTYLINQLPTLLTIYSDQLSNLIKQSFNQFIDNLSNQGLLDDKNLSLLSKLIDLKVSTTPARCFLSTLKKLSLSP
jgi:hypothetical protein